MALHTAEQLARRTKSAMYATFVLAVALFVLAGAVIFSAAHRDGQWDPLGPYPVQQVTSNRDSTDTPVVHLSHPVVPVTGKKCADFDGTEGVEIQGEVSYQSLQPRGTTILIGSGNRPAVDGCVTFRYVNRIPEGPVLEAMRGQLADAEPGDPPILWRITGREVAVDSAHGESVPRSWQTESFRVAP